ncbi:MAG: flagellar biosynthetic protein FliO [Deltaproteobacteria bacterium]|nr:flagellar biosynthetic protein FliO [Deltaproteobacteria bacterium]
MATKTTVVALGLLVFASAVSAWAAVEPAPVVRLADLETTDGETSADVMLEFDAAAAVAAPAIDINRSAHVVTFLIPAAKADRAQKFYNRDGNTVIRKVYVTPRRDGVEVKVWLYRAYELVEARLTAVPDEGALAIRFWKQDPPAAPAVAAKTPETKPEPSAPVTPIDLDKIFAKDAVGGDENEAPAPARAESADAPVSLAPSVGGSVVKMISALAGVVALILIGGAVARKYWKGGALLNAGAARSMAVLGSIPIGLKKQVSLVQVGGETLVLGVSEDGITLLTKLDAPPAKEAAAAPKPSVPLHAVVNDDLSQPTGAPAFTEEFARQVRRFRDEKPAAAAVGEYPAEAETYDAPALRSVRERLATLKRI